MTATESDRGKVAKKAQTYNIVLTICGVFALSVFIPFIGFLIGEATPRVTLIVVAVAIPIAAMTPVLWILRYRRSAEVQQAETADPDPDRDEIARQVRILYVIHCAGIGIISVIFVSKIVYDLAESLGLLPVLLPILAADAVIVAVVTVWCFRHRRHSDES